MDMRIASQLWDHRPRLVALRAGQFAANACLIDFGLASATVPARAKTSYSFGMDVPAGSPPNQGYTVGGAPAGFNQTG
jgi:hypothetical protein